MRRIGTNDGLYHNADVLAGVQGTVVDAAALNAIQEEIIAVITAAGAALNPLSDTQLRDAILAITGGGTLPWGAISGKPPTLAGAASFAAGSYLVGADAGPIALLTPAQVLADIAAAPLANPTLTGVPQAPTAAVGTATTQIATTAFVIAVRDALINASPGALDTLNELAAALGDDPNFAATMTAALAAKLPASALGLTTSGDVLRVTNLDTLQGACFFAYTTPVVGAPPDVVGDGCGIQLMDSGQRVQIACTFETPGLAWRSDDTGTGFGDWHTLWSSENLNPASFAAANHVHDINDVGHLSGGDGWARLSGDSTDDDVGGSLRIITGGGYVGYYYNGSLKCRIESSGDIVTSGSVTAAVFVSPASSRTVKHDIAPCRYGLAEFLQIPWVEYRYNAEITPDNRLRFGSLVEDVALVAPELVIHRDGDVSTFEYDAFIPVIGAALQQYIAKADARARAADSRVRELTRSLSALATRVAAMESR